MQSPPLRLYIQDLTLLTVFAERAGILPSGDMRGILKTDQKKKSGANNQVSRARAGVAKLA